MTNEILERVKLLCDALLHLSLSFVVERKFRLLSDSQATYATHNEIIVRVTRSDYCLLAVGRVWKVYASLQCAFITRRTQGYASFLSEQKSKRYFVGQHSLRREGWVVSVKQPSPGLQFLDKANFVPELCVCLQLCKTVRVC